MLILVTAASRVAWSVKDTVATRPLPLRMFLKS